MAAAVCNSITKRGWFTAASSEDRRVAGTGQEYKFGHPKAEAVGRVAQGDPWLLQHSVKREMMGARSLLLAVAGCFL